MGQLLELRDGSQPSLFVITTARPVENRPQAEGLPHFEEKDAIAEAQTGARKA
ncbi:MAG TPA: hypothetical protein VGR73_06355 [Bryobacteraceae bacterium]|nr:hypothetical protein [Bryobacteraceae bacterium]